jgi:hypothetical protein
MQPDRCNPPLCRLRNLIPRLVAAARDRRRGPDASTSLTELCEGFRSKRTSQISAISRKDMVGNSTRRSTINWRRSGGRLRAVSCGCFRGLEAKRLTIPCSSKASAFRSSVLSAVPVSCARFPAGSPYRTMGRSSSYAVCSGKTRILLDRLPVFGMSALDALTFRHRAPPHDDCAAASIVPRFAAFCKVFRHGD